MPIFQEKELSFRALLIGSLGSIIITASSLYIALRLGALPWPTIFVAILSMALLTVLGKTSLREINIAHTAMSAGAMVAGGLAFTLPAIWILDANAEFSLGKIFLLTLSGTLLGLSITGIIRRYFIENEEKNYPYPIGLATYETLRAGDKGGRQAWILFSSLLLSGIFTVLRDQFHKIPGLINAEKLAARNIFIGFWVSPMALGIGYIIGPLYTMTWALGAFIGFGFLLPVGMAMEWFSDLAAADSVRKTLGIGMMVGTGLGVLAKGILPKVPQLFSAVFNEKKSRLVRYFPLIVALFVTSILSLFSDFRSLGALGILVSLVVIFGSWLASTMAAVLTGQTGINPMEILGIIVLLLVKIFVPQSTLVLVSAATVTAIAAGLAGDMMNDYRVGHLLGTKPQSQRIAETVGALTGSIVSVLVLYVLVQGRGVESLGDPLIFPAPQAEAVAAMASGLAHTGAFWIAVALGTGFFLLKLPSMTLGLGIYLPVFISAPIFLGGCLALLEKRIRKKSAGPQKTGTVIASGLLGGEAITGVVLAIILLLQN